MISLNVQNPIIRPCLILFCLAPMLAWPGIQGRILDSDTGSPLAGANIIIEGTTIGTTSDAKGYYALEGLEGGRYQLSVRYIGYKHQMIDVTIPGQEPITKDITLTPATIELNQIVVTGSRQPEELEAAASSIGIVSRRDIKQRNLQQLQNALLFVPGVTLVGDNINIRGGSGYNRLGGTRHLVLIDNVPVLASDLGEVNWNLIPITEVAHIEVLKGAASSLYGSGAISGVINILTQPPSKQPSVSVRQSVGLYDDPAIPEWIWTDETLYFHRSDASLSHTTGPFGWRIAVSHHRSTGDRENGFFERWYLTGKLRTRLGSNTLLTLFSSASQERKELFLQWIEQDRALQVPRTEQGDQIDLDGYFGYITLRHQFSPRFNTRLRLSYNQQLVGLPFNITSAFTPALGLAGQIQINGYLSTRHQVSAGMDFKYDDVESEYYGKQQARGWSPFLQYVWRFTPNVQLQTGLRWDTYTLVGDSLEHQLSPKIGFSYQPLEGTILHGSVGRGFRAATVVERFISAESKDFRALPNPDLDPERSLLIDCGIRQHVQRHLYIELTGFYNRYSDLIEPRLDSDLSAQFLNEPDARIWGLESMLRLSLWKNRFHLESSLTWMNPREVESGAPMLYRPPWIGSFSPRLRLGAVSIGADYRYMSRIERVAIYPLDERVPTHVWDLHAGLEWSPLSVQVHVRNALNYHYTVSERVLGEIRNIVLVVQGAF